MAGKKKQPVGWSAIAVPAHQAISVVERGSCLPSSIGGRAAYQAVSVVERGNCLPSSIGGRAW